MNKNLEAVVAFQPHFELCATKEPCLSDLLFEYYARYLGDTKALELHQKYMDKLNEFVEHNLTMG